MAHLTRARFGRASLAFAAIAGAAVVVVGGSTASAQADESDTTSESYSAPYYTTGDLTGDGQITQDDLDILVPAIGTTKDDDGWSAVAAADHDDDGVITLSDVTQLSQRMIYDDGPFNLIEASALDMQKAMNAGVTTSVKITQAYLDRINAYDHQAQPSYANHSLNSILATNSQALDIAAAADKERAEGGKHSMLLGVPIVLKDNYDTKDMPTTAGCDCWAANQTSDDATMVKDLRAQGAVIMAKASLDEFAYGFASQYSVGGGITSVYSPYNLNQTAGGSSGGTGASIAANLAGIGFGTDTGGSIRNPSSYNQLVGIRPTVGLTSRSGIVPLALSQDVGGPIARSVSDAAIALDAVAGSDPDDPITANSDGKIPASYTSYLDPTALKGKKIGYVSSMIGTNKTVVRLFNQAVADLQAQGATVTAVDAPTMSTVLGIASGSTSEFKHDLNEYIAAHLAPEVPYRTLTDIIASNKYVTTRASTYKQRDAITDDQYQTWITQHDTDIATSRTSITQLMDDNDLDALIYPTGSPYSTVGNNLRLSPNTGMPAVTLPMGQSSVAQDGGTLDGAGVNLEFLGRQYSEGNLIGMTYSYEQATHHRTTPTLFPALGDD